jgi:hypothetical protein
MTHCSPDGLSAPIAEIPTIGGGSIRSASSGPQVYSQYQQTVLMWLRRNTVDALVTLLPLSILA